MEVKNNDSAFNENDSYETLYTILLEAIPCSVLLIDQDMRIVSANRNFLEKSRRSLDETTGQKFESVFPDIILDQVGILNDIRLVMNSKEPIKGERISYRSPGVPMKIYHYSIFPYSWQANGKGAILLMEDVTEQVRLSEEVRRVEQHLAGIVESASDIILSTDIKGKILTWNTAAERHLGYKCHEATDRYFFEFCTGDDQKEMREIFSLIGSGDASQVQECPCMTKQASFILVSWVFSPMKDTFDRTIGIVAVGRDLTERRKFEMELLQSQKLAALGVMAGGIAHEIRNPLAICFSSAQFLLEDDISEEFRKECAEKIHNGIQRASNIIENLLAFSHTSAVARTNLLNLVPLIKETLNLVGYHARTCSIEVKGSFAKDAVTVHGAATLLQQVFMNLFLNAINAMVDGGTLMVDVSTREAEAVIRISDTGHGISGMDMEKIFDPFYTTSIVGKGTGLGLSICYSIIKQHNGSIEVESIEGKGSVFTVRLPIR